jgi:hypothetical protein
MEHVQLHHRYPLTLLANKDEDKDKCARERVSECESEEREALVSLGYSFVPESAADPQQLRVSRDGAWASLLTRKPLHSPSSLPSSSLPSPSSEQYTEHCLTGAVSLPNKSDFILKISDGKCELLPVTSISGLKRVRGEEFLHVSDSVSKSARTTLRQKHRQSQGPGQAQGKRKKALTAPTEPDSATHTPTPGDDVSEPSITSDTCSTDVAASDVVGEN